MAESKLPERVARLEAQMGRIVSDIESEKRTRADTNKFVTDKLDKIADRIAGIERKIWMAVGALAFLSLCIQIYSAVFKK